MPALTTTMPEHWRNAASAQQARASDPRGWWRTFNDPRLDALVEQALAESPGIEQAALRLHAARTLHRHVDASFLPDLHARTSAPIDPDASAAFFVAGFDATWELGIFGRRTAAERIARGAVDAALADAHDVRVTLVAEVVRNWIDLRAAQQREDLLQQILAARQRQMQLMDVRVQLKLASPRQLAQARAAAAESEAALSGPRQDAIAAAQSLAALLGRTEPDPDWLRAGAVPQIGEWTISAVPADLLRTRPDIARSQADVLQAAGELGLARAEQYPSVILGGSVHWSINTTAHRQTQPAEAIAGFGPVIDIPLFDWGMRKAHASAKSDELQAAAIAYRKAVLAGVAEVETALGTTEQQRLREASTARAWQAQSDAAQAVLARQQLGLSSEIDSIDSQIERDQAALELAVARDAHGLAYVALYKALGGAPAIEAETGRLGATAREDY